MTARLAVLPVWELHCQGKGCPNVYRAYHPDPRVQQQHSINQWNLRREARAHGGWQVRAPRSRKPDLCPACKPPAKDPR